MRRFRQLVLKILFPRLWFTLLCVPVAAAGLVYVFLLGHSGDAVAVPLYVFSTYTLTIVCAALIRGAGPMRRNAQRAVAAIPPLRRYLSDAAFRVHTSLYFSLSLNLIYAGMKFTLGLRYRSAWFGTLAVYYFLLAVMRFLLLHFANRKGFGADIPAELRRCRLCGVMLLVMNIALAGEVILVVFNNEGFRYPGYLIYVMALYAFYNVITAAVNLVKYRRYRSPVISAAKAVSLAAALVSVLSLETAMLAQFGGADTGSERIMTACTGIGVCLIVFALAVGMICRTTKQLKRTEDTV